MPAWLIKILVFLGYSIASHIGKEVGKEIEKRFDEKRKTKSLKKRIKSATRSYYYQQDEEARKRIRDDVLGKKDLKSWADDIANSTIWLKRELNK